MRKLNVRANPDHHPLAGRLLRMRAGGRRAAPPLEWQIHYPVARGNGDGALHAGEQSSGGSEVGGLQGGRGRGPLCDVRTRTLTDPLNPIFLSAGVHE